MDSNEPGKQSARHQTILGLIFIVLIWLTAGFALPFVNVLKDFSPPQLMVFRGSLTALIAFILLRGAVGKLDSYAYGIAIALPLATLGLFQGIRSWGVGPTIIVITATPVINLAISVFRGRGISLSAIICFILVFLGILIARWGGNFNWTGFCWSIFALIMNGVLYELLAQSKSSPLQKCFCGCLGSGILGLILSLIQESSWTAIVNTEIALHVLLFAFIGGFIYWFSTSIAFKNLPIVEASILAQVETPAVLVGAIFFLDEQLSYTQWFGVLLALAGSGWLVRDLAKAESKVPNKTK